MTMNHILVLPDELRVKLSAACADAATHSKWVNIGVNTVDEMIGRIVKDLNDKYGLSIISTREETPDNIKEHIESAGNKSIFTGYFENENGCVDALFCYIPPDPGNANDCVSMKVMPPIFGVYKNIQTRTRDKHIHCMPVFIVSLCTTSRVNNASVKKQIICCETSGYYYHDIFQNEYHDVIGRIDAQGNPVTTIKTLNELDDLLGGITNNKWFEVDYTNKIFRVLANTITNSSNATSDVYRLSLYVIPGVYLAVNEGYAIDITNAQNWGGDVPRTLRHLISKF